MKFTTPLFAITFGCLLYGNTMAQDMDIQGDASNGNIVLQGKNINPSLADRIGVKGVSTPGQGWGVGVEGVGGYKGVSAKAIMTGGGSYNYALDAVASGSTVGNRAVRAIASGTNAIGVYGEAPTGANQWGMFCKGNMYVQGTLTQLSDSRMKRNVEPLRNNLSGLMALNPKRYEFRTDEFRQMNLARGKHIGLLAQEVERVFPELVSEGTMPSSSAEETEEKAGNPEPKTTYKSVDYNGLIPVLIGAIQEQQAQIDALKRQLAAKK